MRCGAERRHNGKESFFQVFILDLTCIFAIIICRIYWYLSWIQFLHLIFRDPHNVRSRIGQFYKFDYKFDYHNCYVIPYAELLGQSRSWKLEAKLDQTVPLFRETPPHAFRWGVMVVPSTPVCDHWKLIQTIIITILYLHAVT